MEHYEDNADGGWSYFGNASAWNNPAKWSSTPNLNPTDTKALQSFAHGNIGLDRSRGVIRDDGTKFHVARVAVALFGSPLTNAKFRKVDVKWGSGSNFLSKVTNVVTSALNPVNATKDTAHIIQQNAPIVGKQILSTAQQAGAGIAKLGAWESTLLKQYVQKVPVIGKFISAMPNYADFISNAGTKLSQYQVHTTPQPDVVWSDEDQSLINTLTPAMRAQFDKLSAQDKKDFIEQYKLQAKTQVNSQLGDTSPYIDELRITRDSSFGDDMKVIWNNIIKPVRF